MALISLFFWTSGRTSKGLFQGLLSFYLFELNLQCPSCQEIVSCPRELDNRQLTCPDLFPYGPLSPILLKFQSILRSLLSVIFFLHFCWQIQEGFLLLSISWQFQELNHKSVEGLYGQDNGEVFLPAPEVFLVHQSISIYLLWVLNFFFKIIKKGTEIKPWIEITAI